LAVAEQSLAGLKVADEEWKQNFEELQGAVSSMKERVAQERFFVGKYLKTEKGKRKELFYAQVVDKL